MWLHRDSPSPQSSRGIVDGAVRPSPGGRGRWTCSLRGTSALPEGNSQSHPIPLGRTLVSRKLYLVRHRLPRSVTIAGSSTFESSRADDFSDDHVRNSTD